MKITIRPYLLFLLLPFLFHSCSPVDEKAKRHQYILDSIADDSIRLDNIEARIDGRHERWAVKTLADTAISHLGTAFNYAIDHPTSETVKELEERKFVGVSYHTHRLGFEKTIVEIHGIITSIRAEDDNDIHIELRDSTSGDSTIACEAVDPNDEIAAQSPYLNYFKDVSKCLTRLHEGDRVTITGVLFEDRYHRPYRYRIRNFLEVHPILKIVSNKDHAAVD